MVVNAQSIQPPSNGTAWNKKVVEAEIEANTKAVDDVIRASNDEVAQWKSGDERIVDSRRHAVEQLRQIMGQLQAGNDAKGQPVEQVGLLAPDANDSAMIKMKLLENEIAQLKAKIADLQKSQATAEKENTRT